MFDLLDNYNFVRVDFFEDLPAVGLVDTIYLVNQYKKSYYWNGSNYVFIRELNPDYIVRPEKGSPGGVAPLDGAGLIPPAYIPPVPIALNFDEYKTVITNPPAGVWTNTVINPIFSNKIIEITIENTNFPVRLVGVRIVGSANALEFELTNGHNSRLTRADGAGAVEIYASNPANVRFYVTGVIS